ncbi:hypothetical protein T484DRAFT_3269575 [Baffinella frigidus]|nr:hypothetical protein T484DRAFT_3269575 [Cryptophyta sp. CCMP2293]
MDGTMGVQSEVGTGSNFWFTGVFKKILGRTNVFPVPTLHIPKVRAGTPLTVLLKAENETLRLLLTRYLEALGIVSTAVDSLPKAVQALERNPDKFDILFFCPSIKDLNHNPYHAAGLHPKPITHNP